MQDFPALEKYQDSSSYSEAKGYPLNEQFLNKGFDAMLGHYSSQEICLDECKTASTSEDLNGKKQDTFDTLEGLTLKEAMSSPFEYAIHDNPFVRYAEWHKSMSQTNINNPEKDNLFSGQQEEANLEEAMSSPFEYTIHDNPIARYAVSRSSVSQTSINSSGKERPSSDQQEEMFFEKALSSAKEYSQYNSLTARKDELLLDALG